MRHVFIHMVFTIQLCPHTHYQITRESSRIFVVHSGHMIKSLMPSYVPVKNKVVKFIVLYIPEKLHHTQGEVC